MREKRKKRLTTGAGAVAGMAAVTQTRGYQKNSEKILKQAQKVMKDPTDTLATKQLWRHTGKGYAYLGAGAAAGGAAAYGGYKAYKHFKQNNVNSPANARNQISETRTNGRVGKKPNQPFYYRTVKGKKQRVKKGKR